MNISIIIPCYNEEDNLDLVYLNIIKNIPTKVDGRQIIFINDGSTDQTAFKIEQIKAKDRSVESINLSVNSGYGKAVRSGFKEAKNDYIVYIDGDGQYDFLDFAAMLELLESGEYQIVGGIRTLRQDKKTRNLLAALGGRLACSLFNLKIKDIDCGFKAIKRDSLKKLNLQADSGLIFSLELYLSAKRKQIKITQVPVGHFPRKAGYAKGVNLKQYSLALRDLWRNRGRYFAG